MAMTTEFIFTPWPSSPLWPLFQLHRWRVPARLEPSLVELALLSCVAAPLAAAFQVFFSISDSSGCWQKEDYSEGGGEEAHAAPPDVAVSVQLLLRALANLKRLLFFFLLMRTLHWTARRIFCMRCWELLMSFAKSAKEEKATGDCVEGGEDDGEANLGSIPFDEKTGESMQEKRGKKQPIALSAKGGREKPPAHANQNDLLDSGSPTVDSAKSSKCTHKRKRRSVATLVVLGSGGHTTEMLRLMADFDFRRFPCVFVMATSDKFSETQACMHLQSNRSLQARCLNDASIAFSHITRCREVGQSLWGLPFLALHAFCSSLVIILKTRPRLVLLNGPGTCVPLAAAAFFCEFLLGTPLRVVYVESLLS
ncbi:hypothetical protein Esti_002509 [Eimeria stiedai]